MEDRVDKVVADRTEAAMNIRALSTMMAVRALKAGTAIEAAQRRVAMRPAAMARLDRMRREACRHGAADTLVVDAAGDILDRQGQPGRPGSFDPPIAINNGLPSRDVAMVLGADRAPVIASVDASGDAVSLLAWRAGGFVRIGSLATGLLPSQVVAADLNGDGWDDLVVRNAGDGTLSVFFHTGPASSGAGSDLFLPPEGLLGRIDRIANIPAEIVQGRYNMVCPPETAFELAAAWPGARLTIVPDAGHSALEPGVRTALVSAVERFRRR